MDKILATVTGSLYIWQNGIILRQRNHLVCIWPVQYNLDLAMNMSSHLVPHLPRLWAENNCIRLTHRHDVNLCVDLFKFIQVLPL